MKIKTPIAAMIVLAGMILVSAQRTYADTTVVYKITAPDGSMQQTIRYLDKQHVRVDIGSNPKMSMLKLGDKVYMISGKVVQDMAQLAGIMAMMGKQQKNTHAEHVPVKYKDTGRTETIAGVRGKVYSFVERGKSHEVVLGQNKDLQAAVLGAVHLIAASNGVMPNGGMLQVQPNKDISPKSVALLRLDNIMRLQSMSKKKISKSAFVLPAKPQQMGGLGGLMKGAFRH